MTRRGGSLGLVTMLGVALAAAPAGAQGKSPCPDPEIEEAVTLPGAPTVDQTPRFAELPHLSHHAWLRLRDEKVETFDLRSRMGLQDLKGRIAALQAEKKPTSKGQQRALAEALRLVDRAIALHEAGRTASPEMGSTLTHLNIVAEAYGYEFITPIPEQTSVHQAAQLLEEKVATGRVPAANPAPQDSPFWVNPGKIGAKDLHRPVKGEPIDLRNAVCKFDEPKSGYGTKGGFDIDCGKAGDFKLKFGPETRTEPFNSRIYNALGFNVPTVEYTPGVTLRYDRRILSQFNCRREIKASIAGLVPFPVHQYVNPFGFVRGARMKDGTRIGMAELYEGLFGFRPPLWTAETIDETKQRRPELEDKNYKRDFEDRIDTLITFEGSLEVKDKAADSIGNWNWNSWAYRDLREVRGAAVLSMWLGNYDVRWDNNKVKLVKDGKGNLRLAMYISDIGAGLGNPRNILVRENDQPNAFPWQFTVGPEERALHPATGPYSVGSRLAANDIAVIDYLPDFENDTATAVTREDMLWMARMIAELTEDQIKAALIAANFQSAEVYLLTEKLLNRREHLLRDSGGGGGVKPRLGDLRNHDPRRDRPMSATLPDKREVVAPTEREMPGRRPLKLLVRDGKVREVEG